ncbi:MAG: 1-phosphofructokinase family hexose kinase [Saprospiraceae bacterium]|nr:1-phosphofructokinase family hexose kinase [Saprospiraceae bacterium]
MIYTLTLNPAIDKSSSVEKVVPTKKLRCQTRVFEAGGGGINVSKALAELETHSKCIYLKGGRTGHHLAELLSHQSIDQVVLEIKDFTRENFIVTDTSTQKQYRFGMPGPSVTPEEKDHIIRFLATHLKKGDYLVASGSLPPGLPSAFYAQIASLTKEKEVKLILDTSGTPLLEAAQRGVYLLKPNLSELCFLAARKSLTTREVEEAASEVIEKGFCEVLIVSLGARGALLVTADQLEYVSSPTVYQKSAVGAGDSMVAGIVRGLIGGMPLLDVTKYGVACGTAATMTEGTQLCRKKDVDQLYRWLCRDGM